MDQILLGLGAAGAALLIIAIVVALWEHRRHLAEMRQQLASTENTRDLLQAHAKDVDARLATLAAAVHMQSTAAAARAATTASAEPSALTAPAAPAVTRGPGAADTAPAERGFAAATPCAASPPQAASTAARVTAHAGSAAVAMAAFQSAVTQQWIETEPMVLTSQVPDFDPTMPAELSEY